MARLRLIACVIGVKFDDLRQREQERRNRRLAAVGLFMMVLLCLMGGLTLFAFTQRNAAKRETGRATQATARATSEAIRASQATTRAVAGEQLAKTESARATEEAIRANQATTRALAGERLAEIELAEGLVSRDALSLAGALG